MYKGIRERRKLAMAFLQKPDKWCVHTPCPGSVSGCGGRSDVKPSLTSVMMFSVIYLKVFCTHPLCSNLHSQTSMLWKRKDRDIILFFRQHVTGTAFKSHWNLLCLSETEQSSYKLWKDTHDKPLRLQWIYSKCIAGEVRHLCFFFFF